MVKLPSPTHDIRLITTAATDAVSHLYRTAFKYSKAEELFMDLSQPDEFTDDHFSPSQLAVAEKLMAVLDEISERWVRRTLRVASVPAPPKIDNEMRPEKSTLHDKARRALNCTNQVK